MGDHLGHGDSSEWTPLSLGDEQWYVIPPRCSASLRSFGTLGGSHITALSPQLTGVHSHITLLSSGDTLYESPSPRSITSAIHISKNVKILTRKLDTRGKIQYLALILFQWGLWVLNFKFTHRAAKVTCATRNVAICQIIPWTFILVASSNSWDAPRASYHLNISQLHFSLCFLIIALMTRASELR